jgi:hypothetical protein
MTQAPVTSRVVESHVRTLPPGSVTAVRALKPVAESAGKP